MHVNSAVSTPIPYHKPGATASLASTRLRVVELDLLRFLAALAVVLYHFTYHLRASDTGIDLFPSIGRLGMHGYLGVNLFFMISGFVILWTARDRTPSGFVLSRITRLYPEFWISVLLSSIVFSLNESAFGQTITAPQVLANLTMVPALFGQEYVDGVYWTLFVELKFYALLWGLSVTRQMKRVEGWLFAWLIATIACFTLPVPSGLRSLALYPYAPLFIGGSLFYLIRAEGVTPARLVGVALCALLAMTQVTAQMPNFVQQQDVSTATQWESRIVILLFFATFAVIALRRSAAVPFATAIAFAGALTYPLYLVHNIGRVVVLHPLATHEKYVALVLAVAFSLLMAAMIARVVDGSLRRPFARWLERMLVTVSRWLSSSGERTGRTRARIPSQLP